MANHTHHIDLDKLSEFGHVGVRRAAIFMGLGLNAASREDFTDYELSKIPSRNRERRSLIRFLPEGLPAERVAYFKVEFARWIQDCCLCDLLEHHALFLDRIHFHALVAYRSLGKLDARDDPDKLHNKFQHDGIPKKHLSLKQRFGIEPKHGAAVDQLYEARNALTHDLGIVKPRRGDMHGNFVLHWPKFNFIGIGIVSGIETPLVDMIGVPTEEEIKIVLRTELRQMTYKVGERIEMQTEDLEDILHFFAGWAINSTLAAFADFLSAHGIKHLTT